MSTPSDHEAYEPGKPFTVPMEGDDVSDKKTSPFTVERIITIGTALIAFGGLVFTVNSHDKRIGNMEARQEMLNTNLLEMKGDIKVLLERTGPKK